MKLTKLNGNGNGCQGGTCPTVYATDTGELIVQGFIVDDPEALTTMQLPAGETAVRIPRSLLRDVASDLV